MKVLYVARLFSGLETSLLNRRWQPTGVPTIYKMIEALDQEARPLELLLVKLFGHSAWDKSEDTSFTLDGLQARVSVLAGTEAIPAFAGHLRGIASHVRHLWKILAACRRFRPDVVYIDHGNVWAAGLLARLLRQPVLFRVMGVYPAMRHALNGFRPAHILLRWCYRAPYAAVICTQDGSGIEPWLAQALRPDVPCYSMINGADLPQAGILPEALAGLPPNRKVVLFLGKIEDTKGCDEFLAAFLKARAESPGLLHAVMIGTGSRLAALRSQAAEADAGQEITFIERLPHDQVMAALQRADIYVSLNRFGNMSNANLEAMRSGCCMVFPAAQPKTAVDLVTDRLIPADAVWRIPATSDVPALAAALQILARDDQRRSAMRQAVKAAADRFLTDWNTRIRREMDILRAVAAGRALPPSES